MSNEQLVKKTCLYTISILDLKIATPFELTQEWHRAVSGVRGLLPQCSSGYREGGAPQPLGWSVGRILLLSNWKSVLRVSSEFMLSSGSLLKELLALRSLEDLDTSYSGLLEVSRRLKVVEADVSGSRTVSSVVSGSSYRTTSNAAS